MYRYGILVFQLYYQRNIDGINDLDDPDLQRKSEERQIAVNINLQNFIRLCDILAASIFLFDGI